MKTLCKLLLIALCFLNFSVKGNEALQKKLIADLTEIATIINRDHPASSPKLKDSLFKSNLNQGLNDHIALAKTVTNQQQYHAVLNSFMLGFNDMHLGFRPTNRPKTLTWSGMIFILDEQTWRVAHTAKSWPTNLAMQGDELVSCDGKGIDEWVDITLQSSIANKHSVAQLARYSSWLFVGNNGLPSFTPPPLQCKFSNAKGEYTLDMAWQNEAAGSLYPHVFGQPNRPQAGYSIKPMDNNGYWIEVGALYGDEISQLVQQIEKSKNSIANSQFVVLDIRGNLGGNTAWSDRIANAIYGEETVAKITSLNEAEFYRASKENLELISAQLKNAIHEFGKESSAARYQQKVFNEMNIALKNGNDFAPAMPAQQNSVKMLEPKNKANNQSPNVFLLTDHGCFSSCLLMVKKFKQLGAKTIGKITNSMPRYYDMKTVPLASGEGSIVTMTKVDLNENQRIGPFAPDVEFKGFMDNTQALQKWFIEQVLSITK